MRSACPLTRADDFQSDRAIETLVSREVNYPLTAAPNFLKQFVITELSRQLCNALALRATLAFRYNGGVLVFNRKRAKTSLKKATWAGSFAEDVWGRDVRPTLPANSRH